jgi:hypothetical protein
MMKMLAVSLFGLSCIAEAQTMNDALSARQQGVISISAYTANGDLDKLKTTLNEGLDAGLTVNEINLNSSVQATKTINHRDTETQRKPEPKTKTFQTIAFLVFDFLCVSVSLWLMVLGLLHPIHPLGERLMFANLLFFLCIRCSRRSQPRFLGSILQMTPRPSLP